MGLHKLSECHAKTAVCANQDEMERLFHPHSADRSKSVPPMERSPEVVEFQQSGKPSCKESDHVTVRMVETMICNKILQNKDLVEQCSEVSSPNDCQELSDSLQVRSSPSEIGFNSKTGFILPGWIPNLEGKWISLTNRRDISGYCEKGV